jgi:hypothetical protein
MNHINVPRMTGNIKYLLQNILVMIYIHTNTLLMSRPTCSACVRLLSLNICCYISNPQSTVFRVYDIMDKQGLFVLISRNIIYIFRHEL